MNAPVFLTGPGVEAFLGRYQGLRDHLPGARLPWLAALREAGAEAFRRQGFPTRRIEAWHYTDLSALAGTSFAEPLTAVDEAEELPATAARRAVFVDGRFRADLSTLDDAPYTAEGLAAALPQLEGQIGALARPEEHSFAALNAMLFEDGLHVSVPEGVEGGVLELVSIVSDHERPAALHPRHLISLARGASLTLIETMTGSATATYLHAPVFEIAVAAEARLNHARLQQDGRAAFSLPLVYAAVAEGGTYDNFVLNSGGMLVRNEIHAKLAGPKAACHLNGAQLIGTGQHIDTTTEIDHAAPDCTSRQTYKTVLSGRARGVFQGKIFVNQVAQRTDGYQMNRALLLSPEAEINSKPQLEIYADDVKCSHGATVGELNEESLFYLRSRGVPQAEARRILVRAFLQEAIDELSDPAMQAALDAAVDAWWGKQEPPEIVA